MMAWISKTMLSCLALLSGAVHPATAQFLLRVDGGDPIITLSNGVPGGDLLPAINTSTSLRYRQWLATTKITVSTICPNQRFSLAVVATGVPAGVPAPTVDLVTGMFDTDLITDIPPGILRIRRCTLRYTASAEFSQGNSIELGNDIHNITYTIIAQ
jgi:hypothetical protein